jgi:hypothetical protein
VRARRTAVPACSKRFRPRDLQLVLQVDVRAGQKHVDARAACPFERSRGGLNVFFAGAGQGGDAGPAHFAADAADGGKVARGSNREAGLHDIDAKGFEAWAMRSFSGIVMLQPGDCSPSRSVVSKKNTRSWFMEAPRPFTDDSIVVDLKP